MQGVDKVWAHLGERPVLWHSLHTLAPTAEETALVVREDDVERASSLLCPELGRVRVVSGGQERWDSVGRGLAALGDRIRLVAVHDGARPFAGREMLQAGLEAIQGHNGAIPVVPVHDTIKRVDELGRVKETVDRESLRSVQTPQIFELASLRQAREAWTGEVGRATDDAAMLEAAGFRITCFDGSADNFKITTAFDLQVARLLIKHP